MADHSEFVTMAREMIADDGVVCQWRKQVVTPIDPEKPWAGSTSVDTLHDIPICFLPANSNMFGLTRYREAIEVGEFTTFGLMAPPTGWVPELSDLVSRGGQPLVLRNLDTLRPAEDIVLYILSIV